jgi:IcmF-related N-terminal domain
MEKIVYYFNQILRFFIFPALAGLVYWFRNVIVGFVRAHLGVVLIAVGILIFLLLIYLLFFFRKARKKPAKKTPAEEAVAEEAAGEPDEEAEEKTVEPEPVTVKTKLSAMRLRGIFSRAMKVMKTNITGRDYRYRIPWVMLLGETGSGKTQSLEQAGLKLPLGGPFGGRAGERDECKWWFLEKGAVIDVSGDLLLREDGYSADDRIWSLLLRLLQKYRPERPIDGIVLAIPCEELIGRDGVDGPDLDQASRKADLLNKKLWNAQKILGLRVPVYILVTKCDQVEGFQSFCQSLPESQANSMFGWSSPHSVDTAYSSEWVGKAFKAINRDLFQNQFEMFAENKGVVNGEGLYLFPENLKKLASPLQIYLDRLFRQSVYYDSYLFRGMYFCGDSGVDKIRNVPAKSFFLKDLFDRKIFPEFRLARPQARAMVSKNRAVLATQVIALLIAVIGGLGLWRAYDRLQDDKRAMVPVFRQIDRDFRTLRQTDQGPEGLLLYNALRHGSVSITFGKSAMNLFKGMTNFRSLTYLFIPSSWFSNLHDELRHSMTLAYDGIILKALYIELLQKAKAIFESSATGSSNDDSEEVLAVADTPEFIELKRFVDNLQELERHVDLYNNLRTSKNLGDLGKVVKYLFDIELPSGFYKNARYYHSALGKTDYRVFDPSIFKLKAKFFTLRKLTRALYGRLYNPNEVEVALQRLSYKLDKFARQRRRPAGEIKLIRSVLETIDQTEELLGQAEYAWVFQEEFNLGDPFSEVMSAVEESGFLGEDLRQQSEADGQAAFERLQAALLGKRSILTGRIIALSGETPDTGEDGLEGFGEAAAEAADVDNETFFADFKGEDIVDIEEPDEDIELELDVEDLGDEDDMEFADEDEDEDAETDERIANRLSNAVLALKGELEQLLGQDFMADELTVSKDLELPPGSRLRWDKNLLNEAVRLFEPYETYKQDGLDRFPVDLQHTMENLAKENLESKVLDLISRAQDFETVSMGFDGQLQESDILVEIRNFNKSAVLLNQLLTYFDDLDLVRSYQVLSDVLYWQTATLMTAFNGFLEAEDLYGVKGGDFSWWDGSPSLNIDAFEVQDEKELENYLNFQRTRIQHLADEYARPLVRFFQNSRILRNREEERILFRWERIIAELEKYASKKPVNSIGLLEKFILTELNGVTVENYYEKISPKALASTSGDIFLQRRNVMRKLLFRRCQRLASIRIQQNYDALRDLFNEKIGGKFPFSEYTGQTIYAEADPWDIRDFYSIFDPQKTLLGNVLRANRQFGASGDKARAFLAQMEKVRHFLKSYLGSGGEKKEKEKPEDVPTFDLDVQFRVNRTQEAMANRIIEWRMGIGTQVMEKQNGSQLGRWRYGDPIRLSLRWAKNAPDYPVFAGEDASIKVAGRTITFVFDNKWSLLKMLRSHAADPGDFGGLSDPKPHSLKVSVDARRIGVKAEKGAQFQTKAFVRLILLTTDKEKGVLVMPAFPVNAPGLELLAKAADPGA